MNEELEQIIREIIKEEIRNSAMSSLNVPYHQHTLTNAGQLDASKSLINSPQSTITSVSGTPTSGGSTNLKNADSAIISALITAVNSLITANKNIGLIKSS